MRLTIVSLGYSNGPEFTSLTSARKTLREFINESKKNCIARYGKAGVILSGNGAKIMIGGKQGYHIYAAHSIVKA